MFHKCQLVCAVLLLTVCRFGVNAQDSNDLEWWEDSSLYHVYVRSFMDTDGDGIGDVNGVISQLEYLKEIGIDAIWLSPIYKSPMVDMGYDPSDFRDIDPIFGTMEDVKRLLTKSKQLGIKVIFDMLVNHVSTEHEWFKKSVNREDGFDDVFVWSDGKPDPNNISQRLVPSNWHAAFGGSAWEWNEHRQQYYLHQFKVEQADLNYRDPKVQELILDVFEFWLDQGLDGFRLDATNFIWEMQNEDGSFPDEATPGEYTTNLPDCAYIMYVWRKFVDEYQAKKGGDVIPLYSEAYSTAEFIKLSYGNGSDLGVHVPFNFDLVSLIQGQQIQDPNAFINDKSDVGPQSDSKETDEQQGGMPVKAGLNEKSNAKEVENVINLWMENMWNDRKTANWQTGNHDNDRVTQRMGVHRTDIMNMLLAALPGITVTYYGEEVGMLNGQTVSDFRDPERCPMQWNLKPNAGFSTNSSTWLPMAENYEVLNVQVERGVARSPLNIYKKMHKLKKSLAFKSYKKENGLQLGAISDNVYQIIRSAADIEEYRILLNFGSTIETFHNLGDKTMEYVVLNSYSPHRHGDKVNLKGRLTLMPNEGIVLRWTA